MLTQSALLDLRLKSFDLQSFLDKLYMVLGGAPSLIIDNNFHVVMSHHTIVITMTLLVNGIYIPGNSTQYLFNRFNEGQFTLVLMP